MIARQAILLMALLLVGCSGTTSTGVAGGLAYARELRGAVFDPPRSLSDFSLMSTSGEPFALSKHKGQVVLLYFGYRTCPDFCPTTFAELQRIYRELGEPADQIKVVFITVDPERDSLENLALYTHAFHEDFIGLRGEEEELKPIMDQFGVVAKKQPVENSPLGYLIDHTASLFLIGPDGQLQVQYLYGTDYQDIVHDIRIILQAA